jgi:hypothetical protein
MHAIRMVENRAEQDVDFALVIKTLEERIRGPRPQ